LRGAQRRSNPSCREKGMDCFAALAMTIRAMTYQDRINPRI
jgi:hypothetical protein